MKNSVLSIKIHIHWLPYGSLSCGSFISLVYLAASPPDGGVQTIVRATFCCCEWPEELLLLPSLFEVIHKSQSKRAPRGIIFRGSIIAHRLVIHQMVEATVPNKMSRADSDSIVLIFNSKVIEVCASRLPITRLASNRVQPIVPLEPVMQRS